MNTAKNHGFTTSMSWIPCYGLHRESFRDQDDPNGHRFPCSTVQTAGILFCRYFLSISKTIAGGFKNGVHPVSKKIPTFHSLHLMSCSISIISPAFRERFAPCVRTSSLRIFPFHRLQQIAGQHRLRCNAPGRGRVFRTIFYNDVSLPEVKRVSLW